MEKILNFIGGHVSEPQSGKFLDVFEPATGKVYAKVAASDSRDIDVAVAAAAKAFPSWSSVSSGDRATFLEALAQGIERRAEEFARAESRDTGKPINLSKNLDIPRAAANFRFFASAIEQFSTEAHPMGNFALNVTYRDPLGPVGCISPWNLPLYLLTWKIAPALAAGDTVVAKPSELSPYTAAMLCSVTQEIGFPPGVLNIVHGTGMEAGMPLVQHPKIRAISFTGGTRSGRTVACEAAKDFKKVSLELGGKNPTVIFSNSEWSEQLGVIVRSAFWNQGQICLCGSRIFIEKNIYEKFKEALLDRVKQLRLGDPMEDSTDQGALISKAHLEKVAACVERAQKDGGKILIGGRSAKVSGRCEGGWFFEPTVIEGLSSSAAINQEEVFGPVVSLIPFEREEDLLKDLNSVTYGLSASLWTQDLSRAHRLSREVQAGVVWVNTWLLRDLRTPFGGTKQSGLGREGGFEALRFFTETKNVCMKFL